MKKNQIYLTVVMSLFLVIIGNTTLWAQSEPLMESPNLEPIKEVGDIPPISWVFTSKVIQLENGGFGYQILLKDKVIITQKTIPLNGQTLTLKTKEEAEKVAEIMLEQANKGNFPPVFESDKLAKVINHTKN
jgi:hypothetical protein